MKISITTIAPALILGLLIACAPSQEFRRQVPAAGPQPEFKAPLAEKTLLDNGLTVLSVEKTGLPLIHVRIILRSGSAADPRDLPGVAGFLADVLKTGTTTRTAKVIASEIETRGSSLSISVEEDSVALSFTTIDKNLAPVFDVVTDVLLNPSFDASEVDRVRKRRLATLTRVKADARGIASRVFRRAVYGPHPYSHSVLGTEQAMNRINADILREYYERHFHPDNAAVIIVGNLTEKAGLEAIQARLGDWTGQASTKTVPSVEPPTESGRVVIVDKAGAPQSQLRIGHPALARNHPDYFPLLMCNAILGGLFNSRINMNLREDKGYTYGARSTFSFLRNGGSFTAYTGVKTDVTGAAIHEVLKEIGTMRDTDVTQQELTNAKNRYSLSLPGYFQTIGSIASTFENIFLHDLGLDYYQTVPANLAAVTIDDVRRVARLHLKLDALTIVVVGDKTSVEPGLASLGRGEVEHWDSDGNKL